MLPPKKFKVNSPMTRQPEIFVQRYFAFSTTISSVLNAHGGEVASLGTF
jgi:hypothetical protein